MVVSEKCDVYSFGVVALEGMKLCEVLDQRLPLPNNVKVLHDIIRVAVVASGCLNFNPCARPSIKSVSQSFVRELTPLNIPLSEISVQQLMSHELKALLHIVNL